VAVRESYRGVCLAHSPAPEQNGAFGKVAGEGRGALELRAGLLVAAEAGQQVAADARQVVVGGKCGFRGEAVDDLQAVLRSRRHRDRHRAVQFHHGGGCQRAERPVQRGDLLPVSVFPGMTRGDRGLQAVRSGRLGVRPEHVRRSLRDES
jgi:hypothetical protein